MTIAGSFALPIIVLFLERGEGEEQKVSLS